MVEALLDIVVELLELLGVDHLVPFQAWVAGVELVLVEALFEVSQQD